MRRRKALWRKIGAAALVLAVAVAIGARVAYVHGPGAASPTPEEPAAATAAEGPAGDGPAEEEACEAGIDEPAPADALTERQRELIAAYTEEESSLIERLQSASWQTSDSQRNVHWTENTYTEVDLAGGSAPRPVTYAVSATSRAAQTTPSATTETVTAVLECGDGKTRMVVLGTTTEADGSVVQVLSSDDFRVSTSYLMRERALSVSVDGLTEQMRGLIGGDEAGLAAALTEYCSAHLPAASRATWEQSATIDEAAGTVSFSVMFDTDGAPSVPAMYDRATGAFEVGRSR